MKLLKFFIFLARYNLKASTQKTLLAVLPHHKAHKVILKLKAKANKPETGNTVNKDLWVLAFNSFI